MQSLILQRLNCRLSSTHTHDGMLQPLQRSCCLAGPAAHRADKQQVCSRRARGIQTKARASPKAAGPTSILINNPVGQLVADRLVGTPVFLAMEIVALLVVLALTDAAYSGDWSRIGVISADTEPLLQKLTIVVWSLHAVCGLAAANIASSSGRSAVSAGIKAFLFGSLSLFETLVLAVAADEAAEEKAAAAERR